MDTNTEMDMFDAELDDAELYDEELDDAELDEVMPPAGFLLPGTKRKPPVHTNTETRTMSVEFDGLPGGKTDKRVIAVFEKHGCKVDTDTLEDDTAEDFAAEFLNGDRTDVYRLKREATVPADRVEAVLAALLRMDGVAIYEYKFVLSLLRARALMVGAAAGRGVSADKTDVLKRQEQD